MSKDFSGTTVPRILKFGTNVGYDLYCVREKACCCLSFSLFVHFSFSPSKFSVSASMRARVFKFYIHIESGQVYCGTENKTQIYFTLSHIFFSISHSSVIHREICDKYFSGTIACRIL